MSVKSLETMAGNDALRQAERRVMLRVLDITEKREAVHPLVHARSILSIFENDPRLSILAVAQDERPIGLVERHAFMARMNDHQTRDLFGDRAITNLMVRGPLTVDAELDLGQLVRVILDERPAALAEGFVVVDEDFAYVGVGEARNLLLALARGNGELRDALATAEARVLRLESETRLAKEARVNFAAQISHEIRTPLNGILGLSEALTRMELGARQMGMVSTVRDAAEQLFRVLNDLLDSARLGAGVFSLEEVDFGLASLASDIEIMWRPQAERKGLEFSIDIAEGAPPRWRGDVVRIRQVISSLLSYAVSHTEEGQVRLSFDAAPGFRLITRITDSGPGMCDGAKASLGPEALTTHSVHEPGDRGILLGLALSRTIVARMAGRLDFECPAEGGSRVWFDVPLAAASAPARPTVPHRAKVLPFKGARVLAAEDNRSNRLFLTAMLDAFGCEYVLVENGAEAVRLANEENFEIILMDVQMPILDGVRATQQIRQHSIHNRATPIIALTAHSGEEEQRVCLAAGMTDHLEKPLRPETVLAAMQAALAEAKTAPRHTPDAGQVLGTAAA